MHVEWNAQTVTFADTHPNSWSRVREPQWRKSIEQLLNTWWISRIGKFSWRNRLRGISGTGWRIHQKLFDGLQISGRNEVEFSTFIDERELRYIITLDSLLNSRIIIPKLPSLLSLAELSSKSRNEILLVLTEPANIRKINQDKGDLFPK